MASYERLEAIYESLLDQATPRIAKLVVTGDGTIKRVYFKTTNGPTHGDATFDISKNNSTIYAAPADRIKILNGQTVAIQSALNVAVVEGDEIVIDLASITAPDLIGQDLAMIISIEVAPTRITPSAFQTGSLANDALHAGSFAAARSVKFIKIVASEYCWIRFYKTAAFRDDDAARLQTDAPEGQHGCILDLVLNAGTGLSWSLAQEAFFSNDDTPPVGTVYYNVVNRSGITADIGITPTYIIEED